MTQTSYSPGQQLQDRLTGSQRVVVDRRDPVTGKYVILYPITEASAVLSPGTLDELYAPVAA